MNMQIVDAHSHLHGFSDDEIRSIIAELDIYIVAVAENLSSSLRTLGLRKISDRIYPCIGLHPWETKGEDALNEVEEILKYANNAYCFGEIGLDKRFNTENFNVQKEVFYRFVEASLKTKKPLNIHALDAWKETLDIVSSMGVKKAIFHWYSGPTTLLPKIEDNGYFITINPSVTFQKKHGAVLKAAPLSIIITESDGPYNYKGRILNPRMIPKTLEYISETKNIEINKLEEIIMNNFKQYLSLP